MAGLTAFHSAPSAAGPLDLSDQSVITEFGRLLLAHGYAGDAVPAALGTPPATGKGHIRDDMPLYLRRLERPTPLNTFIKLFVLTQPVTEAEARDAFAPLSLDQIEALGLLSRVSAGLTATLRLSAYAGLI